MEFTEVVRNRYSCKNFDAGKAVDAAKLTEILEAGRVAPTAKNFQEQKIYVIQSAEGLAKIDKATPCRYNAPTCLVVAFDRTNVFTYPGGRRDSGVEDATIVATHMILAAANAGVDSCWVNFFDPEQLAKELGLPENEEILMIMDLGHAAPGAAPLPNHGSRKPHREDSHVPRCGLAERCRRQCCGLLAAGPPLKRHIILLTNHPNRVTLTASSYGPVAQLG